MSDTSTETPWATSRVERLLDQLADAVLAVPGVVRLEPTLSTSGPRMLLRPSHTDGLHVLLRAVNADVDVNLATDGAHQARDVTRDVQRCIIRTLTTHGYTAGSVTVSVLSISP